MEREIAVFHPTDGTTDITTGDVIISYRQMFVIK